MAEVFIYLDESGTVDWVSRPESPYFAFGSALFRDGHAEAVERLHGLRLAMSADGANLPKGFHAKDDSWKTRERVFQLMGELDVEIRGTFFCKQNAFPYVRARPELWLYKYAIYAHLTRLVWAETQPGDTVYVIAAHIDMRAKRDAVVHALEDVCDQQPKDRDVHLAVWNSQSSSGLQIADYGLWARNRWLVRGDLSETIRTPMRKIHKQWTPASAEIPWGAWVNPEK